jgi:hypothetical protein
MRTLTAVLILSAGSALAAAPIPELEKAQAALADGKPGPALNMVEAVAKQGKLDKDNLALMYQLKGIALAMTKKEGPAKVAFEAYLWLSPDGGLPPSTDGKAFKIFRQAKDWARANPALEFRAEPAAQDDKGKVMQIATFVKNDPLKIVRKVRFHVKTNGGNWTEAVEPVSASYAATSPEADAVEWWAELLADRDSVMAILGSEENPVLEGKAKSKKAPAKKDEKPKPVAKADEKPKASEEKKAEEKKSDDAPVAERKEEREPEPRAETEVEKPAGKPFVVTGVRGLGFGLAGVGVVGAIIGVVCGAASAGLRTELTALPNDGSLITTMTQREAVDKENSANGLATAANVMLITGGVLAATGIVLVIAGGPADDAKVSLAPAGLGAVLTAKLP